MIQNDVDDDAQVLFTRSASVEIFIITIAFITIVRKLMSKIRAKVELVHLMSAKIDLIHLQLFTLPIFYFVKMTLLPILYE